MTLQLDLTAKQILDLADKIVVTMTTKYDEFITAPRTFQNTAKFLDELSGMLHPLISSCSFPSQAHPDKEVRDASIAAMEKISNATAVSTMRRDVFDAFNEYFNGQFNIDMKNRTLQPEDLRLVRKMKRWFILRGLELPLDKRTELITIRQQKSKLSTEFEQNLNELTTKLYFTVAELSGVPKQFLTHRRKKSIRGSTKYEVTLKYPDYRTIMKYTDNEAVRKKMFDAFNARCRDVNCKLLIEILKLRDTEAKLLGFANHSEYILANNSMAKTPKEVTDYLDTLYSAVVKPAKAYLNLLTVYKKAAIGNGAIIEEHDASYYSRILMNELHQIDSNEIKQYFPARTVISGMLDIYQELLSLRFKNIAGDADSGYWHPSVSKYRVFDTSTDKCIGSFYLDLYFRDGKFGHYAEVDLRSGFNKADGTRIYPEVCILGNFEPDNHNKPSLLTLPEVITFFHEFGHVMHVICSTTQHAVFSGTNVEDDFVEAPSQMLENWCYVPHVLNRLSGGKMPVDIVQKIIRTKNTGNAFNWLPRIYMAKLDIHLHTMPREQLDELTVNKLGELWQKYGEMGLVPISSDSNAVGSFAHIATEYSSRYYGYMWSRAYSAAMYAEFKKRGPLCRTMGRRYRDEVLAPGGSIDAIDLFRNFTHNDSVDISHILEDMGACPPVNVVELEIKNS